MLSLIKVIDFPSVATAATTPVTAAPSSHIDLLMLTGFLAGFAMLATWPFAWRSRGAALLFAGADATVGFHAFAMGAWPAGIVAIAAAVMVTWAHATSLRRFLDRWWWQQTVGRVPVVTSKGGRLPQLFPDVSLPRGRRNQQSPQSDRSTFHWYEGLN